MWTVGLILVLACAGWAQGDPRLTALHATLEALHALTDVSAVNAGGGPTLTAAKHQWRDWIESQLGSVKDEGDEKKALERINAAAEQVSIPSADGQNLLGSLGEVTVRWESGLLVVTTRVGIVCQMDDSAYVYQRIDEKWQRIWESEQDDSANYNPQIIAAVHISYSLDEQKRAGPTYIMTLGNGWGCASMWHPVYFRIWRVDPSGTKILVDQAEDAYLGHSQQSIVGSIVGVDAVIEFTQRSIDGGVHSREAIRHFLIDGDRVRRVDPVALSPRDFVDEWLTRDWRESAGWSLSTDLRAWHQKLHTDFIGGLFSGTTLHCQTPDLWQVGFAPHDPEKNLYFLVRWTPPYRFALADISDKPWPRCTQPDPEADAWRTLFSTQEWRW